MLDQFKATFIDDSHGNDRCVVMKYYTLNERTTYSFRKMPSWKYIIFKTLPATSKIRCPHVNGVTRRIVIP